MSVNHLEVLQQEVDRLNSKFDSMVADVEELFACLIAQRASKKSIEEIVERAVTQHFNLSLKQFYGVDFIKEGRPRKADGEKREIIEARKWCISILRNILFKSPWTMRMVYPFYNNIIDVRHRPVWDGAVLPKTDEDRANREILLAITTRIKQICKEEGMLDDNFQYI